MYWASLQYLFNSKIPESLSQEEAAADYAFAFGEGGVCGPLSHSQFSSPILLTEDFSLGSEQGKERQKGHAEKSHWRGY